MLERALLELSGDSGDDHVSDLVRRCRGIEDEEAGARGEGSNGSENEAGGEEVIGEPLHRHGSTEEQEEVEK